MINDYDEAQSIAQDVFIKIFKTLDRYKMQGNFQSYIFTIAKNLTLNHIKKRKRILLLSSRENNHYLRYEEDKQHKLEQEGREKLLLSGIKSLKEDQRLALILKVYLGFSYKKIAEITGWSIPKIETLISRAKSRLKNKIYLQENRF
jgi:RNA polymerase sigma-70 factor (ECF subfamily)